MNKQQRGDAMTVVLVVLVVVLAGALAFMAWKAQTNKGTEQKQETTQTEQPKEAERVLAFDTWGVEVPLGTDKTEFSAKYVEEDGGPKSYQVNAKVTDTCDATIGQVIKTDEAKADDKTVTIDGVTYLFVSAQQVSQCGDRMPTDEEAKAQEATSHHFRDDLFTKLRATEQQ